MKFTKQISFFFLSIIVVIMAHSMIPHHHHYDIIYSDMEDLCENPGSHDEDQTKAPFHCHAFNGLIFEENGGYVHKISQLKLNIPSEYLFLEFDVPVNGETGIKINLPVHPVLDWPDMHCGGPSFRGPPALL